MKFSYSFTDSDDRELLKTKLEKLTTPDLIESRGDFVCFETENEEQLARKRVCGAYCERFRLCSWIKLDTADKRGRKHTHGWYKCYRIYIKRIGSKVTIFIKEKMFKFLIVLLQEKVFSIWLILIRKVTPQQIEN